MRIRAKKAGLDKNRRFNTPEEKARDLIALNHQTFFGKPGSNELCWIPQATEISNRRG